MIISKQSMVVYRISSNLINPIILSKCWDREGEEKAEAEAEAEAPSFAKATEDGEGEGMRLLIIINLYKLLNLSKPYKLKKGYLSGEIAFLYNINSLLLVFT
jgi:hypothetical protein